MKIIEVRVGHLFVNVPYFLYYFVDGFGIGGEDGGNFGVDFLQVGHIDLAKLSVPVTVPIAPFFLALFRMFDFALLEIIVELLDRLALKDLQEFLDEINDAMGDCPQI